MKLITQKQALNLMLALLILVMLFHISVIAQIIPYEIVWAGKLNSVEKMLKFESISILLLIVNVIVLLLKGKYLKHKISVKILNWIIGFYAVLFGFNTIGNFFAETNFELYVFTPLTFISALLCIRILIKDNSLTK
jgi:hypothetical protein